MTKRKTTTWLEPVSGRTHPFKVEGFEEHGCVRRTLGRAMFKTREAAESYASSVNDGLLVTSSDPTDTPFA